MTPELQEAIELAGQEQFLELATELGRIKVELENKHAANGTLSSGGYLRDLLSRHLQALAVSANAYVKDCVRLAVKAGATTGQDVVWLSGRIAGVRSRKGLLDSLRDHARLRRMPETFMAKAEVRVDKPLFAIGLLLGVLSSFL